MGGSQSRSMEVLKYFQKQWEYIKSNQHGVKIFRNRDSDHQVQEHHLIIDPKMNLIKQYDIYNYRRVQDTALVSVYAVQNLRDDKPNLCGNRDCIRVLTQSIPIRGSEIRNLPFHQGLYMLSQCLRGFDDCYSKVGGFDINEQMIGLNNRGHVKVWLNQNFEQNHPTYEKPMLQITTSNMYRTKASKQQLQMLETLLNIVQSKCKGGFPENFKNVIKKQCNFVDTYHTIQDYSKKHEVDIPDRIVINNSDAYQFQPFGPRVQTQNTNRINQTQFVNQTERTYPVNMTNSERIKDNRGDNFSFKDYSTPPPIKKEQPVVIEKIDSTSSIPQHLTRDNNQTFDPNRDTLINKLPRDTLISKYQQRQSRTQNRVNIFQKKYQNVPNPSLNLTATPSNTYQPPNLPRYESTYQYQPKISVRNMQNVNKSNTVVRGPSPPTSPRSINFSYQNTSAERQVSPVRTNFVTSERY